jgi:2-dehydro-3-deoxy-D-pentonate aldolase
MKPILRGIIPPVITPLINNRTLDVKGLENLIEYLIAGGVHGLFILGTTGEATSISYKLRKELIKRTSEFVRKRLPVVVGITDTSLEGSLEIADYATEMDLDGVVIAPPYYLPISQKEMMEYLDIIVPKLSLPFLMYEMPGCTKIHMPLDTIRRAKELGAIGVKDSSGDIEYYYSLLKEFKESPDFSIIVGTELFLPEAILHGGHGAVAGGANIFPKLFVDLYNASFEKDFDRIEILRKKLIMLNNLIFEISQDSSKYIKGIKGALSVMKICNGYVAPPIKKYGAAEYSKIEKNMKTLLEVMD